MVRSMKRKASQPGDRRRDRSRVSARQGGAAAARERDRRVTKVPSGGYRFRSRSRQGFVNFDGVVSNNAGGRVSSKGKRGGAIVMEARAIANVEEPGTKGSFYFTNFPDSMLVFRLRQHLEVCGILSDVYIAKYRNSRGHFYGFVRFLNVINWLWL